MVNCYFSLNDQLFRLVELKPIEHLKGLYPDFVPDVFTRLWETRLEPKERLERKRIYEQSKMEWYNRLCDQKLLASNHRQPIFSKQKALLANRSASIDIPYNPCSNRNHKSSTILNPIGIANDQINGPSMNVASVESGENVQSQPITGRSIADKVIDEEATLEPTSLIKTENLSPPAKSLSSSPHQQKRDNSTSKSRSRERMIYEKSQAQRVMENASSQLLMNANVKPKKRLQSA
jgi:hypothetical protein